MHITTKATPPMTPPTMAPMFVDEPDDGADATGDDDREGLKEEPHEGTGSPVFRVVSVDGLCELVATTDKLPDPSIVDASSQEEEGTPRLETEVELAFDVD